MVVLGGIPHEDAMVAGGSESGVTRGAKLVSGDLIILASSYVEMGYLTYGGHCRATGKPRDRTRLLV